LACAVDVDQDLTALDLDRVGLEVDAHGRALRLTGSVVEAAVMLWALDEPLVDLEQPAVAYDGALTLLKRHPELVGIYSTGGGNDGIIQALVEKSRGEDVILVCNELTPSIRSALIDRVVDLVIATPTAALAERTVRAMLAALAQPAVVTAAPIMLPFEIYGPENI
jgi:LacI family transcriptional regulator